VLVKPGDVLLESETFGPILTILEVEDTNAACEWVRARDHPLVLYLFSTNEQIQKDVRKLTTSGNIAFNDTFMQLDVKVIPFGGVGESGHGRQHLKHTFDCFSYDRSSVDIPAEIEELIQARYAPYTKQAFEAQCAPILFAPIPNSSAEAGIL